MLFAIEKSLFLHCPNWYRACTSAVVKARSYTRTSSIKPLNIKLDQCSWLVWEKPPIADTPFAEVGMVPTQVTWLLCTPLVKILLRDNFLKFVPRVMLFVHSGCTDLMPVLFSQESRFLLFSFYRTRKASDWFALFRSVHDNEQIRRSGTA